LGCVIGNRCNRRPIIVDVAVIDGIVIDDGCQIIVTAPGNQTTVSSPDPGTVTVSAIMVVRIVSVTAAITTIAGTVSIADSESVACPVTGPVTGIIMIGSAGIAGMTSATIVVSS
jgi:hypothetical protein